MSHESTIGFPSGPVGYDGNCSFANAAVGQCSISWPWAPTGRSWVG